MHDLGLLHLSLCMDAIMSFWFVITKCWIFLKKCTLLKEALYIDIHHFPVFQPWK